MAWQKTSNRDLFIGMAVLSLITVANSLYTNVSKKIKSKPIVYKEQPLPKRETEKAQELPRSGHMFAFDENRIYQAPSYQRADSYRQIIKNSFRQSVGYQAPFLNNRLYFANAFMLGFVPFKVKNVYNAMNFVARQLRYQFDKKQFGGREEVWLTSKVAYTKMRGDCEDHAILLSDWLETLGFDTRVAIGTYKGGGHAWVVWFDKGQSYIIEATSKRSKRSFPHAKYQAYYEAKYMFSKDYFWEKEAKTFQDDYINGWHKTARFETNKRI